MANSDKGIQITSVTEKENLWQRHQLSIFKYLAFTALDPSLRIKIELSHIAWYRKHKKSLKQNTSTSDALKS